MKNYIEVTSVETGVTKVMSRVKFFNKFGKSEGREILKGYLPNIVAVRVEKPMLSCPDCGGNCTALLNAIQTSLKGGVQ